MQPISCLCGLAQHFNVKLKLSKIVELKRKETLKLLQGFLIFEIYVYKYNVVVEETKLSETQNYKLRKIFSKFFNKSSLQFQSQSSHCEGWDLLELDLFANGEIFYDILGHW